MTHRSRLLQREEKLALLCSLIMTGALAIVLQQLKESRDAENRVGTLSEYEEFFTPATRQRPPHERARPSSGTSSRTVERTPVFPVRSDSLEVVQSDSSSERIASPWDSTTTLQSDVFRGYTSNMVLDSIFKTDSMTRRQLLRQHMQYASSIYDTATVHHLVRLSHVIRRFDDQPVSLEESTRRDLRRYGHPYNPVRPQPPTAQVPLEGILLRVLGYIF